MPRTRLAGALVCATGILAAVPAGAWANVQVGSSGWEWGNPLPQGNTINALSFVSNRGYAAGDFGTLLRTEDGGATWAGLPAGTFTNLTEVQAVDADTVVAGGGCVARRSDDGGRTFQRIAFTPVESSCKEGLAALYFTTKQNGYIVLQDGTVLQTGDGGVTYAQKSAIPGTRSPGGTATPTDVWFLDDQTGFASTTEGKIFQTVDGGNSWKVVNDTNRAVRNIVFVDKTHGYAVGDASLFLRTSDGGATWVPKDAPGGADLTSIRCATNTLCVVTTKRGDQLIRTTDGGDTFTLVTPSTDPILAAAFASPTRIVAGGQTGATVVSDDAGLTFAPIGGRLSGRYNAIRAGAVAGTAFAPGDNGSLAKTVDGGKTWTRGNVSTSEDVLDVSFPTAGDGYALDVQGGLFRTANGGAAWKTLDTGSTARPAAVYASSVSTVMVVGPTGIRRSTDGGGSFDAVTSKAAARTRLSGVDRAGTRKVFAYGNQDIIRSTDGGKTWSAIRKPGTYKKVKGKLVNRLALRLVDFADLKTGFAEDISGRVYRTRNAAKSWTELPGVGTQEAYGMSFSSATKGYLVIPGFGDVRQRSGFLLRTTDGGSTWHPQFVVSDPIAAGGIAATGGAADYLLGGTGSLLSSTKGGDAGSASTLTVTTKKRRLTKSAGITVTGKLSPAQGNERVTVSYRRPGSSFWQHQTTKTAANGSFTTSWRVAKGANVFVAQWQGDFRSTGDGSPTLVVAVGKKK